MNRRHVRLDDTALRQGQRRKRTPYEEYLAAGCGCNHPNASPPCGFCVDALSDVAFERMQALDGVPCPVCSGRGETHVHEYLERFSAASSGPEMVLVGTRAVICHRCTGNGYVCD